MDGSRETNETTAEVLNKHLAEMRDMVSAFIKRNGEDTVLVRLLQEIKTELNEQKVWSKQLLTPPEAATIMNVSLSHIYKLMSAKKLPLYCPGGKKKYIEREDLLKYLKGGREASEREIIEMAKQNIKQRGR